MLSDALSLLVFLFVRSLPQPDVLRQKKIVIWFVLFVWPLRGFWIVGLVTLAEGIAGKSNAEPSDVAGAALAVPIATRSADT
jgi:hypothetical protein